MNNGETVVKEFGIANNEKPLTFNSLNAVNSKQIKDPLSNFRLYTEYLKFGLGRALNVSRWTKKKTQLKKSYFESSEYKNEVVKFNNYFNEWVEELENNEPSFSPYGNLVNRERENKLFKGIDISNCQTIDKTDSSITKKHTQLIKLFGETSENVIKQQNF